MKIVISSGHGSKIPGAAGFIQEHPEAVRVVDRVAVYLEEAGIDVVTFHDNVSTTQNANLNRIVDFHNAQTRDLDVSIHFNSGGSNSQPVGTECLYVTQAALADDVAEAISLASGLKDRGPKKRTDLFFLNNTEEPAILIEVCFVDSRPDTDIYHAKFEQICGAIASAISGEEVEPIPPEPPTPGEDHPTIGLGDDGPAVEELQRALGCLVVDGDFGPTTDTWVKAFQGAANLSKDGVVGPKTWAQVDALSDRLRTGNPRLPKPLADAIHAEAAASDIADFSWPDRGVAPPGYIPGMALCYAAAARAWSRNDSTAILCAKAEGNPSTCALAWYHDEFIRLGMRNDRPGLDVLRHLFVMLIGLGPRESSGRYCEGRDMSASNVASDTAEAGMFQTSWNIRSGSTAIPPLLDAFWENPNGFLTEFKEGVTASKTNLDSYGSGDGIRYQFLSRFCPAFHVAVTAVGMRVLRQHWGPINRREVLLKREADELLQTVQEMALAGEV